MVRNLVIGSEGFVGRPFCQYLRDQGESVVPFDIKRNPNEDARQEKINFENIDHVYFLAWDVGGAKYLYRHDAQFRQLDWNLKLLINIMPQLKERKVPFLFVSSQLAEECGTVYGVTKRLGEVWTDLLEGTRVRLWNVYGAIEETSERSHVVADFVYQAVTTGEIRMLTTGEEKRQFIHVHDVSRAFHCALSKRMRDIYDVSSFEWVSVREVADIIAEFSDAKVIPGKICGSTPITPMRGKIPGWTPKILLRDGLSEMVQNMRRQIATR